MSCERCGAVVPAGALTCPYCQAPTKAAAAAQARQDRQEEARAQQTAASEQQRAVANRARMEVVATQAAIWAAIGTIVCWPAGVIAIIQGVRARALAIEVGEKPPVRAVVAMSFGALSSVGTVVFVVWAIVSQQGQEQRAAARIASLESQVAASSKAPALDHDTACKLAEAYALRTGYGGSAGYALKDFECSGKLAVRPDHAQLENFRFRSDTNSTAQDVFVCFKHGDAWFVGDLRAESCKEGGEPSLPAATQAATPPPHAPVGFAPKPSPPAPHATPPAPAPAPTPAPTPVKGK